MKEGVSISIILPTYNERENLPIIVYLIDRELVQARIDYEIIVVDDNSPDGTQEVCHQLMGLYDTVRLYPREGKLGLGTAYLHGLQYVKGEYVVLMDADLSHHPKYIPQMYEKMEDTKCDLVSGTRYRNAPGAGVYGWDLQRKVVSRGANYLAEILLGLSVTDLTGSFRLYKKEILQQLVSNVKSKGYVFQMEMIFRASQSKYHIEEVPIAFVDRIYGQSKLGAMEVITYASGLLQFFMEAQ